MDPREELRAENDRLRAHVHAMGGVPLGAGPVVDLVSDDEGPAQPEDEPAPGGHLLESP